MKKYKVFCEMTYFTHLTDDWNDAVSMALNYQAEIFCTKTGRLLRSYA